MALIPDNASDSMVNSLWELALRITEEHAKALRDDPTLAGHLDANPGAVIEHGNKLCAETIFNDRADLRGREEQADK